MSRLPRAVPRHREPEDSAILRACLIALGVLILGTVGFALIEGWNLVDSFYMTVITLSTVGFGEVEPLSDAGKLFTSALIVTGVGGATFFFSTIVSRIIEGELGRVRSIRKMKKEIEDLSNHVILCGCGKLGTIVLRELQESGQEVVVIENDPEQIAWLEKQDVYFVAGSAYEDETLILAGIKRANSLLALLNSDSDNIYTTLCARDLNSGLRIIARTDDESGESRLLRAGADQVLSPYRVAGTGVVQRLVRPHVSDFLEVAAGSSGHKLVIEEIRVPEDSNLSGKTLAESNIRSETGLIVAAFISPDGETHFNPQAAAVIEAGATLIVLGERSCHERLAELL